MWKRIKELLPLYIFLVVVTVAYVGIVLYARHVTRPHPPVVHECWNGPPYGHPRNCP